jgi:hypothetical protein
MQRFQAKIFFTVPIFLAVACSEGPTQSKSDAASGWRSVQLAMGEADLPSWTGSGTVTEDMVSGTVTGTVPCPDGGTMDIVADGQVIEDPQYVHGEVSITFDGCEADGLVIDGHLSYEGTVEEYRVAGEYHGDLQWSGAITGTCAIDIAGEVVTGPNPSTTGTVNVSGSVCGHDWEDLI